MTRIKAVLWDIDGTLLNFGAAQKNAINSCFEKFGLGICSEEMLQVYDGINHKYWKALERGELTKPQVLVGRFREFFSLYGLREEVVEPFNDEYQIRLGDTICFYPHALETVQALKTQGICQLVVTNGTQTAQEKKLKKSGLDQLFDGIFISDLIGAEKPFPEFFVPVLKKVEEQVGPCQKFEILIVGDSLTSDMQGGVNIGIRTCWYARGQKNESRLTLDYIIGDLSEVQVLVNS